MGELVIPDKSELVPIENAGKALEGVVSVGEMFDGEGFAFPVIDVIHQGGLFRFPDGSTKPSFEGIVLLAQRANVYWKTPGEPAPPDCASNDAIRPNSNILEPIAETCAKCPYNQFGSAKDGDGKLCRNIRRLVVLCEGAAVPYIVGLSASNLKFWTKYLSTLAGLGIRHQAIVVTELSLTVTQKGSRQWSLFAFKPVAALPIETAEKMFALSKKMRTMLMGTTIGAEALAAEEKGADNNDVPF